MAQSAYNSQKADSTVAWLLWLFLGALGAHRFYLGKTTSAIIMLLTLGGLGFWALIDVFFVAGMIRNRNMQLRRDVAMGMHLAESEIYL